MERSGIIPISAEQKLLLALHPPPVIVAMKRTPKADQRMPRSPISAPAETTTRNYSLHLRDLGFVLWNLPLAPSTYQSKPELFSWSEAE